jgi:hypothetical protein
MTGESMHKNHQLVNIFLFYFYAKRAPKMRNFKRGDFRPPEIFCFIFYPLSGTAAQQATKGKSFFSVRC